MSSEVIAALLGAIMGGVLVTVLEPLKESIMRQELGPSLEVEFQEHDQAFMYRTTQIPTSEKFPSGVGSLANEVLYVRIRVNSTKLRTATRCRGFVTNIERQNEEGEFEEVGYHDTMPLLWSYLKRDESQYIDVMMGAPRYLDVLFVPDVLPKLSLCSEVDPLIYLPLFERTNETYRLSLAVTADGAEPAFIKLAVKWGGSIDAISISKSV